jgi:hypothetical protein
MPRLRHGRGDGICDTKTRVCTGKRAGFRRRKPVAGHRAILAAMIKGTTKRASWTAFVLLAMGCGGRAENQVSAGAGRSDATSGSPGIAVAGSSAGGTPGVGPIDPTGSPTQLGIDCHSVTSPPSLALPCKVGLPIGDNVLECYDLAGRTALQSFIPFGELATMLNQPVQFPFVSLPPPPGSENLSLSGTLVFTQVDPVGRAFVAIFNQAEFTWAGPDNETFSCALSPGSRFWAVAGDFN